MGQQAKIDPFKSSNRFLDKHTIRHFKGENPWKPFQLRFQLAEHQQWKRKVAKYFKKHGRAARED